MATLLHFAVPQAAWGWSIPANHGHLWRTLAKVLALVARDGVRK